MLRQIFTKRTIPVYIGYALFLFVGTVDSVLFLTGMEFGIWPDYNLIGSVFGSDCMIEAYQKGVIYLEDISGFRFSEYPTGRMIFTLENPCDNPVKDLEKWAYRLLLSRMGSGSGFHAY